MTLAEVLFKLEYTASGEWSIPLKPVEARLILDHLSRADDEIEKARRAAAAVQGSQF